jgi:hypothetical protein
MCKNQFKINRFPSQTQFIKKSSQTLKYQGLRANNKSLKLMQIM